MELALHRKIWRHTPALLYVILQLNINNTVHITWRDNTPGWACIIRWHRPRRRRRCLWRPGWTAPWWRCPSSWGPGSRGPSGWSRTRFCGGSRSRRRCPARRSWRTARRWRWAAAPMPSSVASTPTRKQGALLKPCSHATPAFAFSSNVMNGLYDKCGCSHVTFAFSRIRQQRSKKNANANINCGWTWRPVYTDHKRTWVPTLRPCLLSGRYPVLGSPRMNIPRCG